MSRKRARSPTPPPSVAPSAPDVFRSEPIEDRQSVFVGLYSPTLPAAELAAQPDIADAMHRMFAVRKQSKQRSISSSFSASPKQLYESHHDDDGEKYGGKRVEKVLEAMGVEGSIVVARWYGGILLGPVRFAHIETCAREAVKAWQAAEAGKRQGEPPKKRALSEVEMKAQKERLEKVLQERDASIEILRGLLAEKMRKKEDDKAVGGDTKDEVKTATPKQRIDYGVMPVEALKRLERARDATLAFILKEIDKAEQVQQTASQPASSP